MMDAYVFVDGHLAKINCPMPVPMNDEVVIRVKAIGLNRADLLQRQGHYPPPPGESDIPGLEVAGEVVKLGSNVRHLFIGDHVMALVGSGAYAEYCLANGRLTYRYPSALSFVEAAALPEALTTAHAVLFIEGDLHTGQQALIHAAGSGIGSMALQLARERGVFLHTTATDPQKRAMAMTLGAASVSGYRDAEYRQTMPQDSLDTVIDCLGGEHVMHHLALLKPKGRLVQMGCMQGSKATVDLRLMMQKRLQYRGFILRSQALYNKAFLFADACAQWQESLVNGRVKSIVSQTFSFDEAEMAQQEMLTNQHFGKIVITLP